MKISSSNLRSAEWEKGGFGENDANVLTVIAPPRKGRVELYELSVEELDKVNK